MNAHELADKLKEDVKWTVSLNTSLPERLIQASFLLRKQQTEIERLEKELTEAGGMIGVLREYISDLENGLESSIKLNKAQASRGSEHGGY